MDALSELKIRGILVTDGHFLYPSGSHGTDAVDIAAIYRDVGFLSTLAGEIAKKCSDLNVEVVTGPDSYGAILAAFTALHLHFLTERSILYASLQRRAGNVHDLSSADKGMVKGRRILIVDDVVDTGDTMRSIVKLMRGCGGEVVGVGVICNREGSQGKDVGDVPAYIALGQLSRKIDIQVCKKKGPCSKGEPLRKHFSTHGHTVQITLTGK